MKFPPKLKKGDTILLASPSSPPAAPGTPNSGNMRISKALVQVGGPDCRRGGGVTAGGRAAAAAR